MQSNKLMFSNKYFENNNFYSEIEIDNFIKKTLEYANFYSDTVFQLNGFSVPYLYDSFPNVIAWGIKSELICKNDLNSFDKLNQFSASITLPIFGFFGYNLKNQIEDISSSKIATIEFPDLYFFEPENIIYFKNNGFYIVSLSKNCDVIYQNIISFKSSESAIFNISNSNEINKNSYINDINYIKEKIIRGDVYEVNYCTETLMNATLNPVDLYFKLTEISPMPFSGFVKYNNKYILSASPERFLKKQDDTFISQPIKGTVKRGISEIDDNNLIFELQNSEKERAENIMIVDLVRNDLSHTAKDGTVEVVELCKVYSFQFVHQMISTIKSIKSKNFDFTDTIKTCFPMGSMTGAPKISAMKLIDKLEHTNRGVFSGSIGYITPNQDFDFNVIIRSLIYDDENKLASFHVGSAITIDSDAESEYNECFLKSFAIKKALGLI